MKWNRSQFQLQDVIVIRGVAWSFHLGMQRKEGCEPLGGLGKCFFSGAWKCHFPCFSEESFINQSTKKHWLFSNFVVYLSTFGNTDISVYKCIINCNFFLHEKGETSPLTGTVQQVFEWGDRAKEECMKEIFFGGGRRGGMLVDFYSIFVKWRRMLL